MRTASTWGTPDAAGFADPLVIELRRRLCDEHGCEAAPHDSLQHALLGSVLGAAGDPETEVPAWLRTSVPLGIEKPIKSCGIFPETDETQIGPADADNAAYTAVGAGFSNYASYAEHAQLADAELKRELDAGYLEWQRDKRVLERRVGALRPAKMAVIVKRRADGKVKVRLIHDLRRSGTNQLIKTHERLVLPRLQDVIDCTLDLLQVAEQEAREEEVGLEYAVRDFADAFKMLKVDDSEQRYLSGQAMGGWFAYRAVLVR